MKHTRNT